MEDLTNLLICFFFFEPLVIIFTCRLLYRGLYNVYIHSNLKMEEVEKVIKEKYGTQLPLKGSKKSIYSFIKAYIIEKTMFMRIFRAFILFFLVIRIILSFIIDVDYDYRGLLYCNFFSIFMYICILIAVMLNVRNQVYSLKIIKRWLYDNYIKKDYVEQWRFEV